MDILRLGLISDTHGLLRPQAVAALTGCHRIIHAGDIGDPDIVEELRKIAPVTAVRGNMDREPWAERFPLTQVLEVENRLLYILHELAALDLDPAAAGIVAVICGHSHRPAVLRKNGVLYVNPGSAGPRRFSLPVTVARLMIRGEDLEAEIVDLNL